MYYDTGISVQGLDDGTVCNCAIGERPNHGHKQAVSQEVIFIREDNIRKDKRRLKISLLTS